MNLSYPKYKEKKKVWEEAIKKANEGKEKEDTAKLLLEINLMTGSDDYASINL